MATTNDETNMRENTLWNYLLQFTRKLNRTWDHNLP